MPTVKLAPTAGCLLQCFTTGGLPLNAGLLYTYDAGTTTPQATYTTSAGSVQNANPIVLDADGRTPNEVWLVQGSTYRFDLKDSAGNLIKSYDNVTGINDISSQVVGVYLPLAGGTMTGNLLVPDNMLDIVGSVDPTKVLNFEVDGFTAGQTRVLMPQDQSGTIGLIHPGTNDFRLSLTTAVPVTTTDVTGATTIYCVPYKGNKISLYSGSVWVERSSAEFSLALGTLTSGKPYDVFCYDNAGTPTLEFLVWTNDTTRATALTYQDGVLVKTGDTTRRYLGTFYTTAATTTEDSLAKRFLWNYYNRVIRPMKRVDTTNSWSYSTAAFQQANAAAANQLDYVCGVAEDSVSAKASGFTSSSGATLRSVCTGIGIDSTSANSAQTFMRADVSNVTLVGSFADYVGIPGVGRHYVVWLEYGGGSDTQTWYGDNGASNLQTGIVGNVFA